MRFETSPETVCAVLLIRTPHTRHKSQQRAIASVPPQQTYLQRFHIATYVPCASRRHRCVVPLRSAVLPSGLRDGGRRPTAARPCRSHSSTAPRASQPPDEPAGADASRRAAPRTGRPAGPHRSALGGNYIIVWRCARDARRRRHAQKAAERRRPARALFREDLQCRQQALCRAGVQWCGPLMLLRSQTAGQCRSRRHCSVK